MGFKVQLKQAGKKTNKIIHGDIVFEKAPADVKELISSSVKATLKNYEKTRNRGAFLKSGDLANVIIWDENSLEDMASSGKIDFGIIYNEKNISEENAVDIALQAFEDGLIAVFIDGKRYENMNEKLCLKGDEVFTFVKLTMLAGRMW